MCLQFELLLGLDMRAELKGLELFDQMFLESVIRVHILLEPSYHPGGDRPVLKAPTFETAFVQKFGDHLCLDGLLEIFLENSFDMGNELDICR